MALAPICCRGFSAIPSSHAFDDSPRPAGRLVGPGPGRVPSPDLLRRQLRAGMASQVGAIAAAAITIGVWFALESPVFKPRAPLAPSTAGNLVRLAIFMLVSGWITSALLRAAGPDRQPASGICRRSRGCSPPSPPHAGDSRPFGPPRPAHRQAPLDALAPAVLIILAATTRMSADLIEKVRVSHHIYAAWTWALRRLHLARRAGQIFLPPRGLRQTQDRGLKPTASIEVNHPTTLPGS